MLWDVGVRGECVRFDPAMELVREGRAVGRAEAWTAVSRKARMDGVGVPPGPCVVFIFVLDHNFLPRAIIMMPMAAVRRWPRLCKHQHFVLTCECRFSYETEGHIRLVTQLYL